MPSTSTDRLNGLTTSVAIKPPCRVATVANITLFGEQTIDGIAVVAGDRVLVMAQTSSVNNGIYVASASTWARAKDFDGARDAVQGTIVLVRPAAAGTLFYELTTANPVLIGTSSITFEAADPGVENVYTRLADTASASNGDALIGVKSTLASAVATTQHEVNERTRSVFDWFTAAQRADVSSNTGAIDVTAACQAAINSGSSLWFPPGVYRIDYLSIAYAVSGKTHFCYGATFIGVAAVARMGMIDFAPGFTKFIGLELDVRWNTNYTAAIYWHSASAGAPAKSNHFYDLVINNALIGILFGELSPTVPVDAAQSENYIYGIRTRGVERVIYANQSNGFIKFIGGEIVSSKSEWDANNPAVYNFTQSCPITVLQGVVGVVGGDIVKADTQLGAGLRNSGGTLAINGSNLEIASQVFAGSGSIGLTQITDISGSFWGNSGQSWAVLAGTGGNLQVRNFVLNKSAAASAADTAFLDLGGATGWEVSLDNVRAENQLHWIFNSGSGQPERWVSGAAGNTVVFNNCYAPVMGGAATTNPYQRVTTKADNLLDLRGTDVVGNDIATWYRRDISGVGAIALNADVPTLASGSYPNSIIVTPAVTTGSSEVISIDFTSLTTVKATGIKCRPGDQFWMKGWARMTTAGTAQFTVTYSNAAGAASSSGFIANQADLLTSSWQYIEGWFIVPDGAAYFGVGIRGSSGTICRMVGVSVSRVA